MEGADEKLRAAAVKRIGDRRGFYMHLGLYVVVNAGLVGLWFMQGGGYFWPAWVIFGWGIGIVAHAFDVFMNQRGPSEQQIQREMDKLKGAPQ